MYGVAAIQTRHAALWFTGERHANQPAGAPARVRAPHGPVRVRIPAVTLREFGIVLSRGSHGPCDTAHVVCRRSSCGPGLPGSPNPTGTLPGTTRPSLTVIKSQVWLNIIAVLIKANGDSL